MNIPSGRLFSEEQPSSPSSSKEEEGEDIVVVSSEEFYPQDLEGNKVRHISNLEEEAKSISSDYEEVVKRMKME